MDVDAVVDDVAGIPLSSLVILPTRSWTRPGFNKYRRSAAKRWSVSRGKQLRVIWGIGIGSNLSETYD